MTSIGSLLDERPAKPVIHQISPGETVRGALELMKEKDIGCVLVMENDRLLGILSERDYARKMILTGKASHNTPVSEIMTADVICTSRENSVQECMDLMSKCDFRHLPVVKDEQVLGMVSIRDLVASVIREQKDTIEHLQHYISS